MTGYKVVYCPLASNDDTEGCVDGKHLVEETSGSETTATINNLDPWTTYKVSLLFVFRLRTTKRVTSLFHHSCCLVL